MLYRRLFSHVLPYKWVFIAALFGMLLVAAADTGFAWILQPLMDKGFVERDAEYIVYIPMLLIVIALVRAIGDFIDGYCINWVARMVIRDLRQAMFERLIYAPTDFFDRESSGGLVSRLTYDVEQVARASSGAFRVLFRDLLKALFLLTLMFYLSWKLSLIFILVIPLAFLIFKLTSGRFRKISSRIQESVGDITHISKQAFQGHRLVKIFSAYDHEKALFLGANNRNRQQSMKKAAILAGSVPLIVLIMGAAVAGVIWLALVQEIKPGVFTSYLVSMTMIVRPVKNLSKVNEVIQTGMAGAESIFRTIDQQLETDNGTTELDTVAGDVSFREVNFRYASDNSQILKDISFDISAGSTVALVGPSGSGKSTIASMLMRFYTPTSGSVTVDNHPIEEITLKSLRDNAAIVSQEVVLFDDTVRNNITYGERGPVNEEKLVLATHAAHVTEFVNTFEDGMETRVGEAGARLSGGQRQRIAIARALYKDAPILILDEATSSLDSSSEMHIQQAIDSLIRDRTTLVIAHRLSTIENADMILVLDQGEIVERGTHRQLLDARGQYYHLYNIQYRNTGADAG
jgi:subfamily B ATP-binding cassette protein MsbA